LECENLPWPVSHPEDTLLHTALHMAANRFSVPLKSWVDVVRLLDDERVDLERVATRARTWRMATALWATLRVKARWFGEPAPVSVMRTLEPPWGVRRALELGLSGDGRWPVRGDARGSWSRLLYGPLLADDLAATWAWFRESAGQAKRMATGGNTR